MLAKNDKLTFHELGVLLNENKRNVSRWVNNFRSRGNLFTMPSSKGNKQSILGDAHTLGDYPSVEQEVYARFVFERKVLKREVHCEWLQDQMLEIIGQLKLKKPFTASNGWLWRFQRRWRISSSCRTDKVRQSDAVRAALMDKFLDGYLDVQNHLFNASVDDTAYGHFSPNQHWNTDQIPVPFAMPCKRTLNCIGDRAPTRQDVPSGLSKRQATIHLTLRADGEQIVPPVLIVRGTGTRVSKEEKKHYRSLKHVVVYFQTKAWADGDFILWYFDEVFVPALRKNGLMDDQIVFLDNLGSHKVDYVKEYMMSNGLYPMYLASTKHDRHMPACRSTHRWQFKKQNEKTVYQPQKN